MTAPKPTPVASAEPVQSFEPGDEENNVILACQAKSAGDVTVEA